MGLGPWLGLQGTEFEEVALTSHDLDESAVDSFLLSVDEDHNEVPPRHIIPADVEIW